MQTNGEKSKRIYEIIHGSEKRGMATVGSIKTLFFETSISIIESIYTIEQPDFAR